MSFIRRYLQDPGLEEITAIEGVIVIDREPPGVITGLGSGTVLVVGEFEDGEFETPTEVFTGNDLASQFGGFGYIYDGVAYNNPSARERYADGATAAEYWNGNGFISLVSKRFRRLIVCRVDTTVGEVQFTRLASTAGNANFNWGLESGQFLEVDLDQSLSGAAKAQLDSSAGTSPQTLAGGETCQITIDSGTPYAQTELLTFSAGSTTQQDFIDEVNAAFGALLASDQGAGVTRIESFTTGTSANVTIDSIHATLTTLTGYAALATDAGTGTSPTWATFTGVVATVTSAAGSFPAAYTGGESVTFTIDSGTPDEVTAVVSMLSTDTTQALQIARINLALGYTAASDQSGGVTRIVGRTQGTSGSVTISSMDPAIATSLGLTEGTTAGTGNVGDIRQVTLTETKTIVEAADPTITVDRDIAGQVRLANESVSGTTRTIQVMLGTTATSFGFDTTYEGDAFDGVDVSIPAGTRVRNSSADEWVVAKTVVLDLTDPGAYDAKVRPAVDDGTAAAAGIATVNVLPSAVGLDAWVAQNVTPLTVALTEAQLDAAYVDAVDATIDSNSVAKEANVIFSARQANAIRQRLRLNVLEAASEGLRGRMAVVCPPLATTTRAIARSTSAQPGVGAYRDQRVVYAFPGARTFVPQIASRGTAGGDGFTADGYIDVHFDSWIASTMSQLNPEENPAQPTSYMVAITSVEAGNPDVQTMKRADYEAFKKAGIAALRIDDGVPVIQSGKTSVDPAVSASLQNIARRRMADFIQDTLATRLKNFSKRLNTRDRRSSMIGEVDAFMRGLLGPPQRIDSYLLDGVSGNTAETVAAGVYRIILKVRTLPSLDFIVLETEVGESVVTVQEAAA